MPWIWPLKGVAPLFPDAPGRYAAERRHDVHTGTDLYCEIGAEVVAVEDGDVIDVQRFTGRWCEGEDHSPWWNDTAAILVKGATGVVVYGEVSSRVKVGDRVQQGQTIAVVEQSVLKKYKGRPMVMLHVELLTADADDTVWWEKGDIKPRTLRNPEGFLLEAAGEDIRYFNLDDYDGKTHRAPEIIDSAVAIALFEGEILMIKRRPDDPNFTGWCFPGGAVERQDKYDPEKAVAVSWLVPPGGSCRTLSARTATPSSTSADP